MGDKGFNMDNLVKFKELADKIQSITNMLNVSEHLKIIS